ncbi:patatin-like phospholipase family protein [Psychroserpens algicola]|uniref:Patatin-like phospholipase family protein n=1 Tax=Psychroserpens algicola TaxID=1719034 RepID=A0ABT0H3R9_9FLAO|nr:patatin-like phospholipase family protein [Psychroserpens algicola]MCK8479030.1 patatin-like phospholipase family protein [Psychroserpens algicola]
MSALFKSIAMCFSGGGYRAACFSLGAISLFEKIDLLDKVKAISTVSGGTITGVKYAQSQIDTLDFDSFYSDYYNWLTDDNLAERAISHIKADTIWKKEENKHKRKNPINAFAVEYNIFTSHRTLGDFEDCVINKKTHLDRVVFNATDFSSGLQFRFQNVKGTRLRFGNSNAHSKYKDLIPKIKLGDILASSSAFPGGFEPIGFPTDFVKGYENEDDEEIGLMDGGIVDNQGASVFIKNDPKHNPHDLFFICDVASPYMKSFQFADKNSLTKYLTYLSSIPALLLVILMAIFFFKSGWWILYTFSVILGVAMLCIQGVFLLASKYIKKATGINQGLVIPPRRFGFFVIDRAKSLIKMATEVFLKNDRRQNANSIYNAYGDITTTATIYELRCKDGKPEYQRDWELIEGHIGSISDDIKAVSLKSANFGTTLWFSDDNKKENVLDAIIACGEFTACYNLLAHLIRYHEDKIKINNSDEQLLFQKLKSLWDEFSKDPYYLINLRKTNANL